MQTSLVRLNCIVLLISFLLSGNVSSGVTWEFRNIFGENHSVQGDALYYPSGVAVNSVTGDVYVADQQSHQIKKFTADGIFLAEWLHFGPMGMQYSAFLILSAIIPSSYF